MDGKKELSADATAFLEKHFDASFSFQMFLKEEEESAHAKYTLKSTRGIFSNNKMEIWKELFASKVSLSEKGIVEALCEQGASLEYFDMIYSFKPEWFDISSHYPLMKKPSMLHLQWMKERGFNFDQRTKEGESMIDLCAERANVEEIRWLFRERSSWTDVAYERSCKSDNLPVLVWLLEKGSPPTLTMEDLLSIATKHLSPNCIWWILENKIGEVTVSRFKKELSDSFAGHLGRAQKWIHLETQVLNKIAKDLPFSDHLSFE